MDPESAEAVKKLVSKGILGAGVLVTDDIHGDYERLKGRGVQFLQEPQERPYGTEAIFRDDSGNWFSFTAAERGARPRQGVGHQLRPSPGLVRSRPQSGRRSIGKLPVFVGACSGSHSTATAPSAGVLGSARRAHVAEGEAGAEHAGLARRDGQTQPVAAARAVAAARTEAARALGEQLLGEPGTVVADPHHPALDGDLDRRPAVPGGVGEQVEQDALQAARVGGDLRLVHHAHPTSAWRAPTRRVDELAEQHVLQLGPLGRAVQPGHLQHVLDEGAHRLRPVPDQLARAARAAAVRPR